MNDILSPDYWLLPPREEWWYLGAALAGLFFLIGLAEALRRLAGVTTELTRKLVHISVGVAVSFAPRIFSVPLPAILLALFFILFNILALRRGWFPSMIGSERSSFGTVYFPLGFLILILLLWFREPLVISISMLVLAFGDAAAAIVGTSHKSPNVFSLSSGKKSFEGSCSMFAVSFITVWVGVTVFYQNPELGYDFLFAVAGAAAITATAWEALSSRGLDNLTIPCSVAFVLSYYLLPNEGTDIQQFTTGTGLALLVAAGSYQARFLSLSGAVATFLLASVIFGIGGWKWAVPILTFFVLSSLLSNVGKSRKAELADMFEKSGRRDYAQVFANGGVAGILALLSFGFPSRELYPLFVGSIAAAAADTWGTEFGLLGRGKTVSITTLRPVDRGRNGGVTWLGLTGGLCGGLVISFSAFAWTKEIALTGVFALAGVVGSFADSLLGATVQAQYRCPVCGKTTERTTHCANQPTSLVRGFRWLNNDRVNWVCTASGAIVVAAANKIVSL